MKISVVSLFLLVLFIAEISSEAETITQNSENYGAKWEVIEQIKAIAGYEPIEFSFDFGELNDQRQGLQKNLTKIADTCSSSFCKERVNVLEQSLTQSKKKFDRLLASSQGKKLNSRVKRWDSLGYYLKYGTGVMDSEDRMEINRALSTIQGHHSEMANDVNGAKQDIKKMDSKLQENLSKMERKFKDQFQKYAEVDTLNKINANLQKKISEIDASYKEQLKNFVEIEQLSSKVKDFVGKMESLTRTVVTKKLDYTGGAIGTKDIDEKLLKLRALIDDNHEVGLPSWLDCMTFVDVSVQFARDALAIKMEIPIVHKDTYNVNKFIRTPFRASGSVGVLDFDLTFVVLNQPLTSEASIKIVRNLNSCIKRLDGVYICDIKSDTFEENSNKCLSNVILNKTLDTELCANELFIAKLPSSVYILNDAKELWFSTATPKTIETTCGGIAGNLTISGSAFFSTNNSCEVFLTKGEVERGEIRKALMAVKVQNHLNEQFFAYLNDSAFPTIRIARILEKDRLYDIEKFKKASDSLTSLQILEILIFAQAEDIEPQDEPKDELTVPPAKLPKNLSHESQMRLLLFELAPFTLIAIVILAIIMHRRIERKSKVFISDLPISKISS